MDSISVHHDADRAAAGSARSEPVFSVRGLVKRYGSHAGLLIALRTFRWLPLGRWPAQSPNHRHRRKTIASEVQTQAGRCSTHGAVEATREIPKMGFPFAIYAIWRAVSQRRPYLRPECGAAVAPTG